MIRLFSMRRRFLVHNGAQMRMVFYGVFASIVSSFFSVFLAGAYQRTAFWDGNAWWIFSSMGIGVFALIVILGLVISNQTAGPIYRLHQNLKRMADGEMPFPIHIRKGDAYGDLFADYNRVVEKLERGGGARTGE